MTSTARLQSLGMTKAADTVKTLRERHKKLTVAYEHYRYVRQEKIDAFNDRLRLKTMQENQYSRSYDKLVMIPLGEYDQVPPDAVLDALETCIERGCFDSFEIAKIASIKEVKDPIVFGRIDGCSDRFFIAQWDDDVKIEDILTESEG